MRVTRRNFLKTAATLGAAATIDLYKPDLLEVFAQAKDYWHIAWLNGATCTGCPISLAQAADPDLLQILTSITVGDSGLPIALPDYMQVLHPASGKLAGEFYEDVWKKTTTKRKILVVEGAVQDPGYCTIAIKGVEKDFRDWLADAATIADYIIALGSCASFGGIPHAKGNVTGAKGVAAFLKEKEINKPVINLPRCPGHPDSLVLTLASVIIGVIPELDSYGRPTVFYGMNMHDGRCPYRPYYDRGVFIQKVGQFPAEPGEEGCRYKIGCKGPVAFTDCALRKWNNHVSYCVEVGAPCIACSEAAFPDGDTAPFYQELPSLPMVLGLPAETWGQALVAVSAIGCAAHFVKRVAKKKEVK